jgi:hypothetical protein
VFGRKESTSPGTPTASPVAPPAEGKGRPTPTRKEAEAASRARAKGAAHTGKALRQQVRSERMDSSQKIRAAMKSGDERYLPPRDKGPLRRFIRDFVDVRLSMAEFLMPLLLIILLANALGQQTIANGVWTATLLLVLLDTAILFIRVRRELKRRFPGQSTKGTTTYLLLRAMQLRFMRLPKPQVKLGQALPEKY